MSFNHLCSSGALTKAAEQLIKASLDPFHDDQLSVTGMPDADGAASLVQVVTRKRVLSVPSSAGEGLWDAHVVLQPLSTRGDTSTATTGFIQPVSRKGDGAIATVARAPFYIRDHGPCWMHTCASGQETFTHGTAGGDIYETTGDMFGLGAADYLFKGASRIIAAGIEVHNSTSALNKQGASTSYALPAHTGRESSWQEESTSILSSNVDATRINAPPSTIGFAENIPGSLTMEASEGAYLRPYFHYDKCDFTMQNKSLAVVGPHAIDAGDGSHLWSSQSAVHGPAGSEAIVPIDQTYVAAHDTVGVYFTGLSQETTLTVTLRLYIERAPDFHDSDLIVMAKPSPKYDPLFLECYDHCAKGLPVAVRVGDNANGDWWRRRVLPALNKGVDVLRRNRALISTLGAAVPGGPQVANALNSVIAALPNNTNAQRAAAIKAKAAVKKL